MSEMVERVARALFASWITDYGHAGFPDCVEYDKLSEDQKTFAIKQARAAIAAMRAPDDRMLQVGTWSLETCLHDDPCGKGPKHMWADMIDAALEGK